MKCDAIIPAQTARWADNVPFLLWEVGQRVLVEHWMNVLFRCNAELRLWMEEPDEQLFAFICDTFPLNRRVQIEVGAPRSRPEACTFFDAKGNILMRRGPQLTPCLPRQSALVTWFEMVKRWLEELQTSGSQVPELETQIAPGVFVGHHCEISKHTQFIAPCWVGSGATVRGAVVGPYAVIGEDAVVAAGVLISESYVLSRSFVGADAVMRGQVAGPLGRLEISSGVPVDTQTGRLSL